MTRNGKDFCMKKHTTLLYNCRKLCRKGNGNEYKKRKGLLMYNCIH
jgi:hypothetical protein